MLKNIDSRLEVMPVVKPTVRARVWAFILRRPRLAAVVAALLAFGGAPVAANADTGTDTTGTSGLFSGAGSALSGTLIPAVVAIVLIGSLFWLGLRWYQKGKNAGNK